MKVKMYSAASMVGVLVLGMVGCGSGGGGDEQSAGPQTGKFIDGPVEGLSYRSPSYQGVTNSDGEFEYKAGETTVFSFAGVTLGESQGASVVTPTNLSDRSSNPDRVLNVLRLLQTLDADNDHSNGVQLPELSTFTTNVSSIDFDQTESAFEADSEVGQFLNDAASKTALIDSQTARDNFEEALKNAGVHSLEGRTFYRYENGSGAGFGSITALWCDTWYFNDGNFYQNNRTLDNLDQCSDEVSDTPFATYTVNSKGQMIWLADFDETGRLSEEPLVLLNDKEPYLYRFGTEEGDRERNRLYRTKGEVEALLSSTVFEANGDRLEVSLEEVSMNFFRLVASFPQRTCSVIKSRYITPGFTSSKKERFSANSQFINGEVDAFVQNGDDCIVTANVSNPDVNTKFFVVVRGKDGIGLENLKASIVYRVR